MGGGRGCGVKTHGSGLVPPTNPLALLPVACGSALPHQPHLISLTSFTSPEPDKQGKGGYPQVHVHSTAGAPVLG